MRRWASFGLLIALFTAAAPAAAQEARDDSIQLSDYLEALSVRRLLASETGSVERLRELVQVGETAYFAERYDEAALLLFEVAESPRFADFVDLDEFRGAELMLASAVAELGALRTASRYLERVVARGVDDPYFGPAYRRYVDISLESGDIVGALSRITALVPPDTLPTDAANELRYLRGRGHYDATELGEAATVLGEITRRSRFYANARYLMGVIAARAGDLQGAEDNFCSIATTGDTDRYTFYVDERYFELKDLAWVALGRVAHEGQRSEDAFYYYFQVPNDSERVAEALFEGAFAMYEGDDQDTAIDLLDQLEARYPASPFVHEATLLRGYVHLGRCEFDAANDLFVRYLERFGPMVDEIDRILESPARQARVYEQLLAEERREAERVRVQPSVEDQQATDRERASTTAGLLLAMLRVDPVFFRLHAQVHTLDAEAGRAGRLSNDLAALGARLSGSERPREAVAIEQYASEAAVLRSDIAAARAILTALTEQLDNLRDGGAEAAQLEPLEQEIRGLATRVDELETQFESTVTSQAEDSTTPEGDGVEALLARDSRAARRLPARVAAVRLQLVGAANDAALRSLRGLRERIAAGTRRARIGRIDSVMGSKRRIEIQIQSLAAGRFPAELQDPLRIQGLLREDEEYWPFEGEHWADEFRETAVEDDGEDFGEPDDDDEPEELDSGDDEGEG